MEQANVLAQLEHLKTFPEIQERLEKDEIDLHGWYYDIGTGEVHEYMEEYDEFVVINEID